MDKVFFRTGFNYDADAVSRETGLACDPEDTRTQESFAAECDINEIVRRFGLTGTVPENFRMPVSGDFTGVSDFHSAMNLVVEAQRSFDSLPAELRARFGNDPQALLLFLEDGANREEAVKLGLVAKPAEKTRDVVQAVDELAAKLVPKA